MSRWTDNRDPDDARETATENVSNDGEERAKYRCPKCGDRYNTLPGHMRACDPDDDSEAESESTIPRRPHENDA